MTVMGTMEHPAGESPAICLHFLGEEAMVIGSLERRDSADWSGTRYVVCEYWPAGNVEGEFAQQVLPPVKSGAGRMLPSIGLLTLAFLVTWLRI